MATRGGCTRNRMKYVTSASMREKQGRTKTRRCAVIFYRISVKCGEITPKEDHLLLVKPVRESYLGEGVNTPNLATMKDFIRFYVVMSRGWFFAGFTHGTKTPTYGDERSEV